MTTSPETLFTPLLDGKIIRIKLPINGRLGSVNAYAFDDTKSWTLLDCGYNTPEHKNTIKAFFQKYVSREKPLKRLIISHFHPDHIGLSHWLAEKNSCDFLMSKEEYDLAYWLSQKYDDTDQQTSIDYYLDQGFSLKQAKNMGRFFKRFASNLPILPECTTYLSHKDPIVLGNIEWTILCTPGHSPNQLCFFSEKHNILISGDVLLEKTTPNVSLWPYELNKTPLMDYLKSHVMLQRYITNKTTIYPGHGDPFTQGITRLNAIQIHQHNRRQKIAQCLQRKGTQTISQLVPHIYSRMLASSDYPFAIGETQAQLNFMKSQKTIEMLSKTETSPVRYKLK